MIIVECRLSIKAFAVCMWLTGSLHSCLFLLYCIRSLKPHDKPIQRHKSASIKPDIENIQGNSPQGQTSLSPGQIFLDGIVHSKINKWTLEWLWYRRAHARLPRYGLPSLASLSSVVTNIKPRGDWKERGAGGTTLIRSQTPIIIILFGFNFR